MTIINLSSKIEQFGNQIENAKEIEKSIELQKCTDFRILNNLELLIYNGRTIMYSCCYGDYKRKKYITHIYNRNSELVYGYDIDYSK